MCCVYVEAGGDASATSDKAATESGGERQFTAASAGTRDRRQLCTPQMSVFLVNIQILYHIPNCIPIC